MLEGVTLNGRYRVDRLIGGDAHDGTYEATDLKVERNVALKGAPCVPGGGRVDRPGRSRLGAQATTVRGSGSPVLEVGTDESLGLDFVVMELPKDEAVPRQNGESWQGRWRNVARVLDPVPGVQLSPRLDLPAPVQKAVRQVGSAVTGVVDAATAITGAPSSHGPRAPTGGPRGPRIPEPPQGTQPPRAAAAAVAPSTPPAPSTGRNARRVALVGSAVTGVAVVSLALFAALPRDRAADYLASSRDIAPSRAAEEAEIQHIRAAYRRIEDGARDAYQWRMELGGLPRFEWPRSDSAYATVYQGQDGIGKIRVRVYHGSARASFLFYYDAGALVFVHEVVPSIGGGNAEQRYYFSDRALIRWRDVRNDIMPVSERYDELSRLFLRISDRLVEQATGNGATIAIDARPAGRGARSLVTTCRGNGASSETAVMITTMPITSRVT